MAMRALLALTGAVLMSGQALAGPCTQKITELGQAVTARHEGAGPAIADNPTTGSTNQAAPATPKRADAPRENEAMAMLQRARDLDARGQEDECMSVVRRVEAMAPATAK
ncbi:hypothetical protein [Salinarimonas soli]|uniref:Uncharacterized protein n=1 Tax=Salinarimonas soli TaxID=1638099 RepID=A0A5B2VGU3_9HYPH|nr:hypothetical protein [Salinarimonas soli]KAA2237730.1 hypothetical protein F0L46_08620 [Salinarimonas soli]